MVVHSIHGTMFMQPKLLSILSKSFFFQALYHSIFRPEIGQCKDVPVVPITFPFQESKLSISLQMVPQTEQKLHINLGFKTRNSTAVLAHGIGRTEDGAVGLWEVFSTYTLHTTRLEMTTLLLCL